MTVHAALRGHSWGLSASLTGIMAAIAKLWAVLVRQRQYSAVQSDVPNEGEVETDGQLEVQLDGGTLVVPADGILDLDVNLGGDGDDGLA